MYAVIQNPQRDGRNHWEQYSSYGQAKQIAAFYRYTYGDLAEVWTLQWAPGHEVTLGRCLKRECIDETHRTIRTARHA